MRAAQLKQFESLTKNIRHSLVNEDTEPDLQLLADKLKLYVEILANADRNNTEEIYDYFCESNGMDLLRRLLRYDQLLVVKTLSLMLINLKNELWISFILSQPIITDLIGLRIEDDNDELTEHYISFLKSLSIRLDSNQISLFYNKKSCKFPLVYQALKFYNHPDNMVRTSVMNLTLGIMKIKNERVTRYFETFPFTLYFIHFCCSLIEQWTQLDKLIATMDANKMKHRLKMEISDQQDALYYLYDMYQYGSGRLKQNLKQSLMSYCILPVLIGSLIYDKKSTTEKSSTGNSEKYVSRRLSLYLLLLFLRIFKDAETITLITSVLFGRRIHRSILDKIKRQIYSPHSYKATYDNHYYWDKFDFEIDEHCESLFSDIAKFETDHGQRKRNGEVSETAVEFNEQVGRISGFVGFGLLEYGLQQLKQKELCNWEKYVLKGDPEDMELNPVRTELITLLEGADDSLLWIISNIIISVQKNQQINNETLKFCGLLMPKLDTVNYLDEFNINSINRLRNIALKHLQLNTKGDQYRLSTLRNLIIMIDELTFKQLEPVELKCLLGIYESSIVQLKNTIRPENMYWLAKWFEEEHRKWMYHAYINEPAIPYSVFIDEKSSVKQEPIPQTKPMPHDPSFDEHVMHHLPSSRKEEIMRYIIHFTMCRSVVTRYLQGLHRIPIDKNKQSFQEAYTIKFNQTLSRWKPTKIYQFENRHMMECKLQPLDRKLKPTTIMLIVEDQHNFVLVEPSKQNSEGTIILNVRYKGIECEILKEDNRLLLIRWTNELVHGEYTLIFPNDIQCMAAYERIRLNSRESFEQQQSFILKYVQNCSKELKTLIPNV